MAIEDMKIPLKSNKKTSFALIIILIFACALSLFLVRKKNQTENRLNLLALREKISLKDSKSKVRQIIATEKFSNLSSFNSLDHPERIIVSTPLEFGATNWILLVDFENSEVISLKVRTADNNEIKPSDAPEDKT